MWTCGWAGNSWYLKDLSISHRISISKGQSCIWFSKEVCIQSKRRCKISEDDNSRGGPAATRSPDITEPGGNTSICFCSNQRAFPFQLPLIFFPSLNTVTLLNRVLTICICSPWCIDGNREEKWRDDKPWSLKQKNTELYAFVQMSPYTFEIKGLSFCAYYLFVEYYLHI